MLESLSIQNIVLINKLHLPMKQGLCVLTGETGSGKSILLDALGLAIGYRSSNRLLRAGEKQGSVIAEFDISNNLICQNLLKTQDIDFQKFLILRRIIYADGKSKAFINDIPITQNFLNQIGETLLEVHGQNEQRGLLNPSFHREILDDYGNLAFQVKTVFACFEKMKTIREQLNSLLAKKDEIAREQDYLRHILNELESFKPKLGEEEELNIQRIKLMNKEKILNVLNSVKNEIEGKNNLQRSMLSAQNSLSRSIGLGENLIDGKENSFASIIDSLEKSSIELNEAILQIDNIYNQLDFNENNLEEIEDRLFAIRGLARKFQIRSDDLPDFIEGIRKKLSLVENQEVLTESLKKELKEAKEIYLNEAKKLSKMRKESGKTLSEKLMQELKPLKMEKTVFDIEFQDLNEENWSPCGLESVKFVASTNPGMPMNDLSKIASGGELSRFMLALKVVLSRVKSVPTIIFDEIDAGIGGAIADAVGERLKRLGKNLQVMVVTHHPQVASKGDYHLRVRKNQEQDTTNTFVDILENLERTQEIARMLSGESITDEALKTAEKLMEK
jgi:DNA repair protein RecN (Recombination protein N)